LRKGERDLFIFPSKDAQELAEKSVKRQGYNLFHWDNSGVEYWAISGLNEAELRQFAEIIQNRLSPSPWN